MRTNPNNGPLILMHESVAESIKRDVCTLLMLLIAAIAGHAMGSFWLEPAAYVMFMIWACVRAPAHKHYMTPQQIADHLMDKYGVYAVEPPDPNPLWWIASDMDPKARGFVERTWREVDDLIASRKEDQDGTA